MSGTIGRQEPPALSIVPAAPAAPAAAAADKVQGFILDFGQGSREQSQPGTSKRATNIHSIAEGRRPT